jgi:hypothetical protein
MEVSRMPIRTAGKRGRLPAEPLPLRFIHEYATVPLPAPGYPVDVTHGIRADSWLMLGNGPDPACTVAPDGVGDCTFAARQHLRMAKAAGYGLTEQWETSNQLVEEYLAYDHGRDNGAVISRLLLAWYRAGKILGFAPVDHSSAEAIDSAMQAFGGVYVGVDLTGDAEQLFGDGQPWTVANGEQPDPDMGHCIAGVKATATGRTYVTWGAEQEATADWSAACLTEAWAIVTSEDEAAKLDMASLIADIEALHGKVPVPSSATPLSARSTHMFAPIEAVWRKLDGEAREEAEAALADLKAEAAKFRPLVAEAKGDVESLIAQVAPEVKAAVETRLAKLLADLESLLQGGAS